MTDFRIHGHKLTNKNKNKNKKDIQKQTTNKLWCTLILIPGISHVSLGSDYYE